jgi:hypothetical protein
MTLSPEQATKLRELVKAIGEWSKDSGKPQEPTQIDYHCFHILEEAKSLFAPYITSLTASAQTGE